MKMTRYQNVAFKRDQSVFVDTNQPNYEASFAAKPVKASTAQGLVPMVKVALTLRNEVQAAVNCGNECPPTVTESFKVEYSILEGAANLSALRAEVNRLMDKAEADYALTQGMVPPVYATFVEE